MSSQRQKAKLNVIPGPARSGKTARVLEIFAQASRDGRSPLLVVPASLDMQSVRRRLCERIEVIDPSAVLTFVALAEKVLRGARVPFRPISLHQRELIIRSITAELDREDKISFFAGSLASPGLYRELLSLIRELKTWQIEPEKFRRFPTARTARDRELALIYERYQDLLRERRLYDSEGRFWEARRVLESRCPLEPLPGVLLLDGFSDFTPNEMTLLEAMGAHVAEVVISLPLMDAADGDPFEKTRDTWRRLERLERSFEVSCEAAREPQGAAVTAAIAAHLFRDAAPKTAPGDALKAFSTAGVRLEMRETARECKRLILGGLPARDIVVIVRRLPAYLATAQDAFGEMGIPFETPVGCSQAYPGLFPLLFALGDVVEGGFARAEVTALFGSPYIDLQGFAGGLDAAVFARVAREAGVIRGLAQWRARLQALAARSQKAAARAEDAAKEGKRADDVHRVDADAALAALEAVERLWELLQPFSRPLTSPAAAALLREVVDALGLRRRILDSAIPEGALCADLAAFAAIDEGLAAMAESDEPALLSMRDFLTMLERLVAAEGSADATARAGGVRILDAASARNLSFPVVFLAGLTGDAWPSRLRVGPFYTRRERDTLSKEHGMGSRDERMHVAAERLLFYQAATRAREKLYLSWPASDEDGKAILRSFYVEELLNLFELPEGFLSEYGPARAVLEMADAASAREAGMAAGTRTGTAESAAEAAGAIAAGWRKFAAFPRALRGAAVETRRESLEPLDRFDGVLSTGAAGRVAQKFPPGKSWSQSHISSYALCPLAFFLRTVLGVERPEEPEPTLTARELGSMAHDVMARFFKRLREAPGIEAIFDEDAAGATGGILDEALAAVAAGHESRYGLAGDALWGIERDRLRRMLREFWTGELERLRKPDREGRYYVPAFFEHSFGKRGAEAADDGGAGPVFQVAGGARESVHGRIDRVDFLGEDPLARATGEGGLAVIDYKTSSAPSKKSVQSLCDLQMPIYLYALRRTLAKAQVAMPLQAFYLTLVAGAAKTVLNFTDAKKHSKFEADLAERIIGIADGIRGGRFPAEPVDKCPSYCPGRGVCRYSESRLDSIEAYGSDKA